MMREPEVAQRALDSRSHRRPLRIACEVGRDGARIDLGGRCDTDELGARDSLPTGP